MEIIKIRINKKTEKEQEKLKSSFELLKKGINLGGLLSNKRQNLHKRTPSLKVINPLK